MENNNLENFIFNNRTYKTKESLKRAQSIFKKNQIKLMNKEKNKEKNKEIYEKRRATIELNKNFGLPLYTSDYQPSKEKLTREERINKFNNKTYKHKGEIEEKLYEGDSPYTIIKRDILNSAFTEISIKNESLNKKYSIKQLYYIYTEKIILLAFKRKVYYKILYF